MLLHGTMHMNKLEQSTSPAGMTISETPTATTPEREQNTPAETLTTSNELPMNSQLNHSDGVIEVDVHLSNMELEPDISCLDLPYVVFKGRRV